MTGGDQDITAIPVGVTPAAGQPPSIWYRSVTLGYLSSMQMRLVAGRTFTADDRKGAPLVGIINEEAARKFWPGENPVGRVLASGRDADAPRITIVGVLASAHHDGANQPFKTELFLPFAQFPSRGVTLILQPSRDLASLTSAVRQTLHDVDPLLPVSPLEPLAARAGSAVALPRSTRRSWHSSPPRRCYSPRWASMASWRTLSRSASARSAFASRWARSRREFAAWCSARAGRLALVGLVPRHWPARCWAVS